MAFLVAATALQLFTEAADLCKCGCDQHRPKCVVTLRFRTLSKRRNQLASIANLNFTRIKSNLYNFTVKPDSATPHLQDLTCKLSTAWCGPVLRG